MVFRFTGTHRRTDTHTQTNVGHVVDNIQVDLQLQAHICSAKQLLFHLPTDKTVQVWLKEIDCRDVEMEREKKKESDIEK